MSTEHLLLPSNRWDSVQQGEWFLVGDRTKWDITLRVAKQNAGSSITVVIETLPDGGQESDWIKLTQFGPITTTGEWTKTTDKSQRDFEIKPFEHTWIRARIAAITGIVIAEVRAVAPFFDTCCDTHLALLSKELREWSDGLNRMTAGAEDEIVKKVLYDPTTGELSIDLRSPGCCDALRREIGRQADHDYRREVLSRSGDPNSLKALRELSRGAPGSMAILRPYLGGRSVWRGR